MEWFERGKHTSPMTNEELSDAITENEELKNRIEDFLKSLDFDKFEATPDLLG